MVARMLRTRSALARMRRRLRVRRATARVRGTVVIGAAWVGVGVGLLLVGILNLKSSADGTQRASALLEQVITVEGLAVDVETGLRGYIITGAPVFLTPLEGAERSLPGSTATLLTLAARDRELADARSLG